MGNTVCPPRTTERDLRDGKHKANIFKQHPCKPSSAYTMLRTQLRDREPSLADASSQGKHSANTREAAG